MITPRYRASTSPILIGLLAAILLALIALIVVVAMPRQENAPAQAASRPSLKTAGPGDTVSRQDLTDAGYHPNTPSKAIDTGRIQETYRPGAHYHVLLKAALKSRASLKDWGIIQDMNLNYAGEAEVFRTIETNDGTTMVETREFRRVRNLSLFCGLDDVRLDIGPVGDFLLGALEGWADIPPGVLMSLDGRSLKTVLDNIPALKQWTDQIYTDSAAKGIAYIDDLQGKKVRIRYQNGQGVVELTPIDCSLTPDEQSFFFDTACISDPYLFPNLDSKEGDSWTINGADLMPLIDPSLKSTVTGKLTVRRGKNVGDATHPAASLRLEEGVLDLQSTDEKSETRGHWEPRGDLIYSFADRVVTQANLGGTFVIDTHSTDHILFEARQTVEPVYQITYSCEVVP